VNKNNVTKRNIYYEGGEVLNSLRLLKKIKKIGKHPIFSLYILKEDFRIFFSLFK
jgi:hypothetical protein